MIKTQIQLEEWQYDALKRTSATTARSVSDIIREGVTLFLNKTARKARTPLHQIAGRYKPLPISDLKAHDEDWVASIR